MIPLSLLFVLGSLGLLVWGLAATSQMLVWGSLGASIAAGVCLLVSVLLRRRTPAADGSSSADLPPLPIDVQRPIDLPGPGVGLPALPPFGSPGAGHPGAVPTSTGQPPPAAPPAIGPEARPDQGAGTSVVPTAAGPESSAIGVTTGTRSPTEQQPQDATAAPATPEGTTEPEPPQEDIAVAAALRAAQLDDDVLVVDGRPRYHLPGCAFIDGKPTVPLPLSTARRTGFTPCGLCCPDSTLLARARAPQTEA